MDCEHGADDAQHCALCRRSILRLHKGWTEPPPYVPPPWRPPPANFRQLVEQAKAEHHRATHPPEQPTLDLEEM